MAQKILVRSPNWIGDHVMARAFYEGLRAHYRESHITLLCASQVAGLEYPGLFDEKLVLEPVHRKFPQRLWHFSKKITGFDVGISLPASLSSAFLLFAAKIPHRIGFDAGGAFLFLTAARPWRGVDERKHKSDLYLELLEFITGRPAKSVVKTFAQRTPEKMIVVAPGAGIALREWPYFRELLRDLPYRYPGYRIVVVGSKADEKWRSGIPVIEDRIGSTTLEEVRALCDRASLVIANDSGLAHVAATLSGAPTVVLFGPGDPNYILPQGEAVVAARVELACSPCEKAYCRAPYGYQRCLKDLTPELVWKKIETLLPSRRGFSSTL